VVNFSFFVSILNCLAVPTAISSICFLCVLGQSGAQVLRNPSYVSLKLLSALRVHVFIFSRNGCVMYGYISNLFDLSLLRTGVENKGLGSVGH
jgi:hypothetical protein